jgi:CheY-like chemotaxis protein
MEPARQTVHVLVAEDNEINQAVVTGLLAHARPAFSFTVVDDGAAALKAWREREFDLILMDLRMPGMDGREAARSIRAEEAAAGRRRTPIVALTGEAGGDEVAECLAAGMDDHAAKPIELPELLAAIDRAMAGPGRA